MAALFHRLIQCALHPVKGFQGRAGEAPSLGDSFKWMMLLRGSFSVLSGLLTLHAVYRDYPVFKNADSPMWQELLRRLPADLATFNVEDLRAFLGGLPDLPPWASLWPWVLVLGPLGIASAWLHNAVWDHTCLWILGGLKKSRSWRVTFIAEAEAMQVGTLDAAFSLLSFIPLAGPLLAPLFMMSGAYFWVMRGLALAAFHHAPMWKGAVATALHILLAALCLCGMLGLCWLIVIQSVMA
ncbi:MAG: hypothetical protein IPQ13_04480 [Holophagaceae bacterium]|nr:hypothetical protein [Holophagaceae bacterium]